MSDLRARAAQAADAILNPNSTLDEAMSATTADLERRAAEMNQARQAQAAPIELDATIEASTSTVPVHTAYSRVMGDVQYVAKDGQRSDSGGRYRFRGIDALLNAVGPALRKHGVVFVPSKILAKEYDQMPTGGGKIMQRCKLTVSYAVLGPAGDVLPVLIESIGEAFDSGDKAGSKAMSVALRTAYIQAFAIPVDQPEMDPERGPQYEVTLPPPPSAEEYARIIQNKATSVDRLLTIQGELKRDPDKASTTVQTLDGEDVRLWDLLIRIGKARQEASA